MTSNLEIQNGGFNMADENADSSKQKTVITRRFCFD